MSGSWQDAPENPFNQMDYTRGGGGYDNRYTRESNDRRAHAMPNDSSSSLPRFATREIAEASSPGRSYAVVGDDIIRTSGPGSKTGQSATRDGPTGTGPGNPGAVTPGGGGGRGSGSRLTLTGGPGEKIDLWAGGGQLVRDMGWTDGGEWEEAWGEWGGALAGLAVMGADLAKGAGLNTGKIADDVSGVPSWLAEGAVWAARMADQAKVTGLPSGLPTIHRDYSWFEQNATTRMGAEGHWKTGGGF